jgi:phosphate transport system permease protein
VSTLEAEVPPTGPRGVAKATPRGLGRFGDPVFRAVVRISAVIVAALVVAILVALVLDSRASLQAFGLHFLWSKTWDPTQHRFGALAAIYGTVVSTVIAMVVATPLALVIALLLVELLPPSVSRVIGTAIELLAAIPSIIYGMWGLFVLAPFMAAHVEPWLGTHLGFIPIFSGPPAGLGMLTVGMILALMILPFITAVARDVLRMVPAVIKEASYGMGSTTWEVTRKVSLRYGLQGVIGAVFLGLGRALGETMAVAFVAGQVMEVHAGWFWPMSTITSTVANSFGEASDKLLLSTLIELGLILFVITVIIQLVAHFWLRRVRASVGVHL